MQPYSRSIFDLFDGKKRYAVPLFQRQYVWNRQDQWEPLWEDIQRKLHERLEGKSGPPHFLGAMVIDQKRFYGNQVPTQLVIDGQQRLTTFQIFLAALRDVCAKRNYEALANECDRYLFNTGMMADAAVEQYKVWPTAWDREVFCAVIDSKSREELERRHPLVKLKYARKPEPRPLMVECYLYFYGEMEELLDSPELPATADERVNSLYESLRGALQVVTVELEGQDDPQVIFESLNARGQPLLPSDLLRNFIFWRAAQNKESQEELYQQYWLPFDELFWREEEKQGRLLRPRSDLFLHHYLAFRRMQETNIGHLYSEYKYWINTAKPFPKVEDELVAMTKHREFFRELVECNADTRLGRLGGLLNVFDIRTAYPLILGLLEKNISQEMLNDIFTDIESYVVRRAVCGLTTKGYNRVFLAILSKLQSQSPTRKEFRELLLDMQGDSSVWPKDDDFRQAWLINPLYDSLGPAKVNFLFREIEARLHSEKSETVEIKSALSVEHVMPQGWITHWRLPTGRVGIPWETRYITAKDGTAEAQADVEASMARDRLIHTMGNLTLLTQPLNSAVSYGVYANKRPEILKQSALTLNRYFQDVHAWDENSIGARGEKLFQLAQSVWPHGS